MLELPALPAVPPAPPVLVPALPAVALEPPLEPPVLEPPVLEPPALEPPVLAPATLLPAPAAAGEPALLDAAPPAPELTEPALDADSPVLLAPLGVPCAAQPA